jgi:hypothetical protein
MPKIDLNKVNPLTLVLVTIIILTMGVLLGRSLLPILVVNNPVEEQVGQQLDVITNVSQRDRFAGYKIGLPAGWNISYTLASTRNSSWVCVEGEDCQVMVITHDAADAKLTQVILSTPVGARHDWTAEMALGEQNITLNGEAVVAVTERYMTAGEEGSIASDLLLQIYACNSELLCINAGPFAHDAETNNLQVAEFNNFLSQIKFEEI